MLSLSSALAHRGLFLPREEVERLFSAPVSRSELVRYRLLTNSARSLFGGLIVGLVAMNRMPIPGLAFLGIMLGMLTLPVLHQLAAILFGAIERRLARRLKTLGSLTLYGGLALGALVLYLIMTEADVENMPLVGSVYRALRESAGDDPLAHPVVAFVTAPFTPWAQMIAATTPGVFLGWFALCVGLALARAARRPFAFAGAFAGPGRRLTGHTKGP